MRARGAVFLSVCAVNTLHKSVNVRARLRMTGHNINTIIIRGARCWGKLAHTRTRTHTDMYHQNRTTHTVQGARI